MKHRCAVAGLQVRRLTYSEVSGKFLALVKCPTCGRTRAIKVNMDEEFRLEELPLVRAMGRK